MATVTVNLTGYGSGTTFIFWNDSVSLGSDFSADDGLQTLVAVTLFGSGSDAGDIQISISGDNNRFTPQFEATGRIIFTSIDGEVLEVVGVGGDMTVPYLWTPTNSRGHCFRQPYTRSHNNRKESNNLNADRRSAHRSGRWPGTNGRPPLYSYIGCPRKHRL